MSTSPKAKILLVEDSQATADDYLHVLQQRGFLTEHAVSAKDGLEKAKAFQPEVIVLDLQIPSEPNAVDESVEHGFQTLDALLKEDPFRPICVVTTHSEREIVRRAMASTHGGPFIVKDNPDLRRELPRAIDVALASPARAMSKVVREFRALVERNEPDEQIYRKFIHQHWKAILGSEYRDVESPYTITRGGSIDLLAVRWDGFSDLWELKRPGDPIFENYNGWLHHSKECARAIGQLMWYYDAAEKERPDPLGYEGRRGRLIQLHHPRGFVVIGRYRSAAERERLRLENSFLAGLTVLTYDDLIERAEQFLHFLQSYRNGDEQLA